MKAKGKLDKISGVFSGAISAGISARKGKLDLAFLYVPECYSAAGVFTRSAFAAPCVSFTRSGIKNAKALIVNSGNANAATGKKGLDNCKVTAGIAARCLGLSPSEVVVSSTGIIGKQLPMESFRNGLPALLSGSFRKGGKEFAQAIMTTDLVPKEYYRESTIGGRKVKVAGVCKGSGMIAPNMATMLAFLVTDARIPHRLLQQLLREVTDESFNMTSVDTDTSTNDMFLAFSTGRVEINPAKDRAALRELLLECAVDLAKQIARDGEGATRLIEVKVAGGKTIGQARAVAKSVVDSPLVKTAIHGADPNWGRVAAATGKVSGVVAEKVSISFANTKVLKKGQPVKFNRDTLRTRLRKPTVVVEVALGLGKYEATAWGCDLTHGYVDINTEYN